MSNILSCRNLGKSFPQADAPDLEIFKNVSFELDSSETISIVGSSGSGKTSLLQILAGLDTASDGRVIVCGEDITTLNMNYAKYAIKIWALFINSIIYYPNLPRLKIR